MIKLVGPAGIVTFSLWALQYTGPLSLDNPDLLIIAFLVLMLVSSGLSFLIKLVSLPFSRRK